MQREIGDILEEFIIFVFDAYYINVCAKFDDFFLTVRERITVKAHPCANCHKNSLSGMCPMCVFRSLKNPCFKIIFKYLCLHHSYLFLMRQKKTI